MRKQIRVVFAACMAGGLLPNMAFAAPVEGLYQTTVRVNSQNKVDRVDGLARAMSDVIVKVSGSRKAPARAGSGLQEAGSYVTQYTYGRRGDATTMAVTFDERALNTFLESKRIPIWGAERPDTLVWAALQNEQKALGARTPGAFALQLRRALRVHGKRRGLSVALPALPGSGVDYSAIWSGQWSTVNKATRRAGAYASLAARIEKVGEGVRIRWRQQSKGEGAKTWETSAASINLAVKQAVDRLADGYARAFTSRPTSSGVAGESRLTIYKVDSFQKYARLMNYLESLSAIRSLQVVSVAGDEVVVDATLNGTESALRRTFRIGDVLSGTKQRDFVDPELLATEGGVVIAERASIYFNLR